MPPIPAAFQHIGLLALVSVLALLIGNTAAGLAGGLAGSLAFAAATLILAQNAGLNGLDVLHGFTLQLGNLSITVYHRNQAVSIPFLGLFRFPQNLTLEEELWYDVA